VPCERCRNADQDGVWFVESAEFSRRLKCLFHDGVRDQIGWNMLDKAFASVDLLYAGLVDIEAKNFEACLGRRERERDADVAEADHADFGAALLEGSQER